MLPLLTFLLLLLLLLLLLHSAADTVPRVRQAGPSSRLFLAGAVYQGRPPLPSQVRALPARPYAARAAVERCVGDTIPGSRVGAGLSFPVSCFFVCVSPHNLLLVTCHCLVSIVCAVLDLFVGLHPSVLSLP